MKRKNMLVVSILTLTVLASSTAMAFADTDATTAEAAKGTGQDRNLRAALNLTDDQKTILHEARTSDFKQALANLVSAGTFTQAEADALLADMPAEPKDRGDGLFASLTEAQKTALEAKLESLKEAADQTSGSCHGDRGAIMTQAITDLVKDGVLTQEEADTLVDVVEPYLLKLGFLMRTSSGRKASDAAYKHLGVTYQQGLFRE